MNSDKDGMRLGAAARRAGVHVETIRYYQRRGLLPRPRGEKPGMRRYSAALVNQVRFIKRAQRLGFALDDVAELLVLARGNRCTAACGLAERKMEEVERKISDLQAIHKALRGMVAGCRATGTEQPCPLVLTLADEHPGFGPGTSSGCCAGQGQKRR